MDKLPPETVLERVTARLSEPNISKDALVKLLKKAEATLSDMSSGTSLQLALTSLSCSLFQYNLFKHEDNAVRLLVAVCFTEIIRLQAPNLSCSFGVLEDYFRLILSVFKGLNDTNCSYSARRLKILETVAYCKSFLMLLGGCEDLTVEMFDVFFKAVRCKIQKCSLQAIFSIMTNIIGQKVTPRILDVILRNLLRQEKADSFKLAVSVIQDCTPMLERAVINFLASCMLDKDYAHKNDKDHLGRASVAVDDDVDHNDILDNDAFGAELRSSYQEVILKLYQYSPQILTSVFPFLTQELLIDQVDARIKAVHLIGKLLVLSKLHFGQDHRSIFFEFLRKFSDKSTEVRLASLDWAMEVYPTNPSTDEARHILVGVEGRLLDFNDRVRSQAISVICNLACSNLSYFPSELVLKATKRLRDKKIHVRKSAMKSLLELYKIYCIKCSNGLFNLNFDYENIPCGILMLCFDTDCKEFRSQNMELFLADLFPSSLSTTDRKNHWVALFSLLTQPQLKALKFILIQKQRLQHELQAYLVLRDTQKENRTEEVQLKFYESFSKLSSFFLDSSKAKECFQMLHHMKDGWIFKSLWKLLGEHTTYADASSTRVSLLERIGKKHPEFEFFGILSLRCSYSIFNAEIISTILEDILSGKSSKDKNLLYSSKLLLFIVKMFPSLFKGSEDLLLQLSSETTVLTNENLLHILTIAGKHLTIKFSDIYPFLEKMCLLGTRAESKLAIRAIFSLTDSSDDCTISSLCKKLLKSLESGENIPTILQAWSSVARCYLRTYQPYEKQVTDFIVRNIFNTTKVHCVLEEGLLNGNLSSSSSSSYCKLKIYGLKALVKCALPNPAPQISQQLKELTDILGNTIQGEGIIYNNISSVIDKDCLRLAAVKLLLQFAARFDSYIPPKIFHLIIATARDSFAIRKAFLCKVHELLTENRIPVRYACAFALASTDFIRDIRADSIRYLSEFIQVCRRNSFDQHTSSGNEMGQIINSPEYVIVFLIHFLAHDQGFPSNNLEDPDAYLEFCSPLVIILRALVDSKDLSRNTRDTLSTLFVILRAIRKADDALDAQITPKLHVLSDIAMLILKLLGKDAKPSSNTRRMILLPSSFYKVCKDSSKVCALSERFVDENFARRILDVVDSSIIKPCTTSSKRSVNAQEARAMKDYVDDDPNQGNSFVKELLKKRTPCLQPTASVSAEHHKTPQIPEANLDRPLPSSCSSASTEPEAEALKPCPKKPRIHKCDSIPSRRGKKT